MTNDIWNMNDTRKAIAHDPALVAELRHEGCQVVVVHRSNTVEVQRLTAMHGQPKADGDLRIFTVA